MRQGFLEEGAQCASWAGRGAGTDRGPKGEGLGHLLEQEEDPGGKTGSKGQDGKARPAW